MRKVLLVTLSDQMNLGNRLQNYALQTVLQGMDCEVTNLIEPRKDYTATVWHKLKKPVRMALAALGVKRFRDTLFREAMNRKRKRVFMDFSAEMIVEPISVSYRNQCLVDLEAYDYAVTGSDQVWHNWKQGEGELEYFYLLFMPREKRIAYAPSFGFRKFPLEDAAIHKKGLSELAAVSCREQRGAELIRELTGKTVPVVLDPVFLLDPVRWRTVGRKPAYDIPDRYLLVYFLGERTEELSEVSRHMSKEQHLEILDIFSLQEPGHYLTGPEEFVWLVEHADYLCTDSFHGCAFSIIFHRPFTVFRRREDGFEDMFDRIEEIAVELGLEGCIYNSPAAAPVVWEHVERILQRRIDESLRFLRESLR